MAKSKNKRVFRQLRNQEHHGFLEDYMPGLTGVKGLAEFKVLHAISMYANWDTGVSYPSQKTIMDTTGIGSSRTVRNAVQRLADKGILSFEMRKPKNQDGVEYGRKRYFYTMTYPARAEYLQKD